MYCSREGASTCCGRIVITGQLECNERGKVDALNSLFSQFGNICVWVGLGGYWRCKRTGYVKKRGVLQSESAKEDLECWKELKGTLHDESAYGRITEQFSMILKRPLSNLNALQGGKIFIITDVSIYSGTRLLLLPRSNPNRYEWQWGKADLWFMRSYWLYSLYWEKQLRYSCSRQYGDIWGMVNTPV